MRLRKRRGAAMVELAITLPVLLVLIAGIIDVGWLYNHQLMLTNAAREGARLGSLDYDDDDVEAGVIAYLQSSAYTPVPTTDNIDVTHADGGVTVSIDSTVPMLFGMMGAQWALNGTAEMRVE